jgi:hypothetical protein
MKKLLMISLIAVVIMAGVAGTWAGPVSAQTVGDVTGGTSGASASDIPDADLPADTATMDYIAGKTVTNPDGDKVTVCFEIPMEYYDGPSGTTNLLSVVIGGVTIPTTGYFDNGTAYRCFVLPPAGATGPVSGTFYLVKPA